MPMMPESIEFAICTTNEGSHDLEPWKVYRILPDDRAAELGCLRVVDELGEDYLYPSDRLILLSLPAEARSRLLACEIKSV